MKRMVYNSFQVASLRTSRISTEETGLVGVGNLRMSLILMTVSLLGGTIEWFVVVVMYGFFV